VWVVRGRRSHALATCEVSPTTVQLLPSSPSMHTLQCDVAQRLVWRATSLAVYLSCSTTVLHDQPPRYTAVSYAPHP
jgi:hypothetical protein